MRFQCQKGCIRCCDQDGLVYVTPEDIARIAEYLGVSRAEFYRQYVCGKAPLLRLRKPRKKQCPFLLTDGCSIHEVKPLQCRTFPSWPELIEKASERKKAAKYCPGMDRGPLVNIEIARETAEEMVRAFPSLYEGETGFARLARFREVSQGKSKAKQRSTAKSKAPPSALGAV